MRFNTSLQTQGTAYFDSNAREMIRRDYNLRGPAYPAPYQVSEPVAGNYYPVNSVASLQDEAANVGFHVVVDRAMGGASLGNGEIEFMVHRRVQADDSRGVCAYTPPPPAVSANTRGCAYLTSLPPPRSRADERDHVWLPRPGPQQHRAVPLRRAHHPRLGPPYPRPAPGLHPGASRVVRVAGAARSSDGSVGRAPLVLTVCRAFLYPRVQARREAAELNSFGAIVSFSSSQPTTPASSAIAADLPPNVKLMTLGAVNARLGRPCGSPPPPPSPLTNRRGPYRAGRRAVAAVSEQHVPASRAPLRGRRAPGAAPPR